MASRPRSPIPAELPPEKVRVIGENREQHLWDLPPLAMIRGTLQTGDYALADLPGVVAIERKSLEDLVGCCGSSRERFEIELERLRGFPVRAVIVEASWADLLAGNWRSQISPASVTGSVLAWMSDGIPFLFAGSREAAQQAAARLLYLTARRRWRENRSLINAVMGETDADE